MRSVSFLFFKCHIIFWNDGLLWKLLVIIWEKKIEKKLSCPWMRGEENCPPHWCFGLSEQGELGKDGNNSLSLCLSKLKNESYLYYNFKELEQYQLSSKQLSLFSSHEIWKANLKVFKLKIWKTLTTKVWNDGGDNSYSFQNVPIFFPFHPINEKSIKGNNIIITEPITSGTLMYLLFSIFILIIISELKIYIWEFSNIFVICMYICRYECAYTHIFGDSLFKNQIF